MTAILINIIEFMLVILLGFPLLYVLFFSLAGIRYKKKASAKAKTLRSFLIIIPAYREDKVINDCLQSVYDQQYPKDKIELMVMAQQMEASKINVRETLKTSIHQLEKPEAGKAGTLNYALKRAESRDAVLVLDADNILQADFLQQINVFFDKGYSCVQGQRTAKNRNNSLAVLDAASEGINNHIFRRGHQNVGLSSALIGSAMAFDYKVFSRIMPSIKTMMGFDKELEHEILKNKLKIAYAEDAVALDEKIHRPKDFISQRRRWASAQFTYRNLYFRPGFRELIKEKNIDFFNKTLQMLILPRSILLGLLSLLFLLYLLLPASISDVLVFSASYWGFCLLVFALSLFVALPKKMIDTRFIKAIFYLPVGIFLMAKSILTSGKKEYDYRTPHGNF